MQSASHLACDWWKQHPSFWRWLPGFIDGQESKCEDFWFSISSCPFIVILAINREFLSRVHTPFFSPSRHYSTLPSFQAKSHNSPRCSEKWATWNGVGGDIIHHDSWVVSLRKWGKRRTFTRAGRQHFISLYWPQGTQIQDELFVPTFYVTVADGCLFA